MKRGGGCPLAKQHAPHTHQNIRITREPAGAVEAFCKREDSVQRNTAIGRPHAEDAAIARWYPHRTAAVAAPCEIDQSSRPCNRRPAGRAAGSKVRCPWVH